MGAETRPVCHRCAQIKQACDGNLPCARCVRLSLPCRPRDSNGPADGEPEDLPKARIRRVQTGCVMCKRRKKKCDEVRPRCGDCRRLCLDCIWVPERVKDKRSHAVRKAAVDAAADKTGGGGNANVNTSLERDTNADAGGTVPSYGGFHTFENANGNGNGSTVTMMQPPLPDTIATGPGLATFGNTGVLYTDGTTMHMPIRSSPVPSSSSHSNRNNSNGSIASSTPVAHRESISHGYPPTPSSFSSHMQPSINPYDSNPYAYDPSLALQPADAFANAAVTAAVLGTLGTTDWENHGQDEAGWDAAQASSSAGPSGVPQGAISNHESLTIYVMQLMPQLPDPQDKALLNHYANVVATVLSRRVSHASPYNAYLLPMAQGNSLVLHCILALSANHWREMIPYMGRRGLIHKGKATQALAALLPHVDRTSGDVALVSSLLLCMTELFDGTSEGWKLHLKGARRLLTSFRNQHGKVMTGHYKFLLRLARFLDSAATISTCRPPLMGEDEQEYKTLEGLAAKPDQEDSAVYGIPKELFHLVDQVNGIAALRKTRVDHESEIRFRDAASVVEQRIDNWSWEYGGLSQAVWTLTPHNDDVLYATVAFEHAVRLRLHQIVEGYDLNDPKVIRSVEGIVDSVQRIRYGSPVEACLLFPLVMAGGSCWLLEQRVVVQDRLMVMERTCGFGYIHNARDLVERVWERRDQTAGTGTIVNWARIRYEEMNGLVVF